MKLVRPPSFPLLLLAALVLSGIGIQCIENPLEPIMPYTDTQLNVPLFSIEKTFLDLVRTDTLLHTNPDGTIYYPTSQSLDPVGLGTIEVQPQSSGQQVTVGLFNVQPIAAPAKSVTAGTIGFPPGPHPFFPASTGTVPPLTVDLSSSLDFVHVSSGTLTLQVKNTLPFPIDFPKGITLRNNYASPADTSAIGQFVFSDTIATGSTQTVSIDLAGKLVRGALGTDSIVIHEAGITGSTTILASDGLEFTFGSTAITADSASAIIPSQPVFSVQDSTLTVDDSVSIQTARFRSGSFVLAVKNNLGISVGVYVKMDDFKSTKTNAGFLVNTTLNGKDSLVIPISVDTLLISTGAAPQGTKLTFSVGITTIYSGSSKQTVASTDFVRAEFRASDPLIVQSVTGKIKPMTVPIYTAVQSTYKLGEAATKFTANLSFDSVRVTMRLPVTGGFPADYALKLIAKNSKRNLIDSIVLPPTQAGIRRIYPNSGSTSIVIDNATNLNGFLGKFFPDMPDSFFVRGQMVFEPLDEYVNPVYYTVSDTSKVYPSFSLDFPLKVGIANGHITSTEGIFNGSNGERVPKEITRSMKSANLNLAITNGMPVAMNMVVKLVGFDSTLNRRDTLLTITPSAPIAAGGVDAAGYTNSPTVSKVTIGLSGTDIEKLNSADSAYVRFDIATTNNGALPVRFRTTDFIKVRASGGIVYTINKPR